MHYIYLILHIYKQFMHKKGYYLEVKGLLLTDNGRTCVMSHSYKRQFEEYCVLK